MEELNETGVETTYQIHLLLLVQIQINIELAMLVTVWAEVHTPNQKTVVDSQSCARKDD